MIRKTENAGKKTPKTLLLLIHGVGREQVLEGLTQDVFPLCSPDLQVRWQACDKLHEFKIVKGSEGVGEAFRKG